MSEFNNVKITKENFTGTITISRPEVYGALTKEAKLELVQAIRMLNRDDEVGCIILTGQGNGFCTGQDLNDRTIHKSEGPIDLGVTLGEEWNPLINAIRNSKKVVIGAVNGVCAGAGVSVALACDLIIAKPGVKFVSGFSKLGLCADAGSTYTFTKAMGAKKALEFFLFNIPLTSEQMADYGLINKASETFLEDAKEMANQINALAPLSITMLKENILKSQDLDYEQVMDREVHCQRFLGNSEDYQEGLKAFFDKRTPKFIGK